MLAGLRVNSKNEALMVLAREAASRTGLHERLIFDALLQRERLGTTGVGAGIAVPHARLPGLEKMCAVFIRLDRAVDFDSVDERPVDLIFLVLSPETASGYHLKALSRVSHLLRDGRLCQDLRRTGDPALLHAILTGNCAPVAA